MTKTSEESYDVVVCGGGLAGLCAAVAAARHGAETCLIQDRPVLGGNASSEVRVTVHGAACFHAYGRETGIVSELLEEERARNHAEINENGWVNSVFDLVAYDLAMSEPMLTLYLNASLFDVRIDGAWQAGRDDRPTPHDDRGYLLRDAFAPGDRIEAIRCQLVGAETHLTLDGKVFIDCTGDAVLADLAGCEWRMGSEGRNEFGELHAPEGAGPEVMGNSIHFRAVDTGSPCPFTAPSWAVTYDDPAFFYDRGRLPRDPRGGFWWIEIGVPWDVIHDAETIRHELTRHALGIWDWMKNRDPEMRRCCRDYALDWIGQVPGKRESRRVMGRSLLIETDIQNNRAFDDEIAFGGWFVDLHTPGGLLAPTSEPASAEGYDPQSDYAVSSHVGPYGIPLGACLAKDVDNLMLAGRNISCTHAALGSVRVMGTTALLGQACGTAAAMASERGIDVNEVRNTCLDDLQQTLLRDGCFLPHHVNTDADDLARRATVSASSSLRNRGVSPHDRLPGDARPEPDGRPAATPLDVTVCQWIAAGERLDRIRICLDNAGDGQARVPLALWAVEHIWDYRLEGTRRLARCELQVPPGRERWGEWPVKLSKLRAFRWLRLDVGPAPGVSWPVAPVILPGHIGGFAAGRRKVRHSHLAQAYRVEPPQAVFEPEQVLSGCTRPLLRTNCWYSDPARPMPQHLVLSWDEHRTFDRIELTFAGQLLYEVHRYPAQHREPTCPRDYRLEIPSGSGFRILHEERGNYRRRRIHHLDEAVTADRLRLTILATNGSPSACVYELRVYRCG